MSHLGRFSSDGSTLVIGAATEFVIVDLHAGVVRDTRVVRDVGDTPLAFAFTPDGRAIAVAGDYSPILIVDVATGTIRRRLAGHKNSVRGLAWTSDGRDLLSIAMDEEIRHWRSAEEPGRVVGAIGLEPVPWTAPSVERVRTRHVTPLPGGTVLAAGRVLREYPLTPPDVLRGHETYAYYLAVSPDGRQVASTGFGDPAVYLWDLADRRLVARHPGPPVTGFVQRQLDSAPAVAFSADGRRIVAVTTWGVVDIDVVTGAVREVPVLVSVSGDRTLRVWTAER